jgi:hypothetical protein
MGGGREIVVNAIERSMALKISKISKRLDN